MTLLGDRPLPPAQRRVAALAAHGYGYVRIATTLGLSRHTVRYYVKLIVNRIPEPRPDIGDLKNVMLWANANPQDLA